MSTFKNKNNLKTIKAEISYKIKNNEADGQNLLVLIKKSVYSTEISGKAYEIL